MDDLEAKRIAKLLSASKAAFFDIDGTLVDSNEFHVVAWDEAIRQHNRSVPRDRLREQIGKGADMLVPSLFPGIDEAERQAISDAHGDIFKCRFLHLVRPFPSSSDLLRDLHGRGMQTFLVSSSDGKEVEHYAHLLEIEGILSGTVSFDDVSQSKPAADLFAVALRKAKVLPEDAIAVGDTPYDVEAAARCKIRTIAVRSGGFTEEELAVNRPAAIVLDVDSVLRALAHH
ncbi:MAG TPA: HAD family hydrolase [Rhizomicrobium sp.]|jgi:membrane protein|nr:HAD family hydrolase [Rhizomicrobium sp.]